MKYSVHIAGALGFNLENILKVFFWSVMYGKNEYLKQEIFKKLKVNNLEYIFALI